MTQAGAVARLAVRELWISFRLFAVVAAFVVAGAVVALLPAPLPDIAGRLAAGLGIATLIVGAVAAWSIADERRAGRAAWLVTRSLPRATLVAGWFAALAGVAVAGLLAAATMGWLAATSVTLRLEATGFAALVAGVGAALLAAIAIGLLAGTLLPGRAAALSTVAACAALGLGAWLAPIDPSVVPGGAYASLGGLTEPGAAIGPGLRAAGVGLAVAAAAFVAARVAMERAEL